MTNALADGGTDIPAFLRQANETDYPRMRKKRRLWLLGRAARELDPSTRDTDYSQETSMATRPELVERTRDTVHDDRRETDSLVADIDAHVRALRLTERPKLDRLAELLDTLTYGEMMEFAQGCLKVPDYKPPGNEYDWASIMHRWCRERARAA